jgi:hypothetical protein
MICVYSYLFIKVAICKVKCIFIYNKPSNKNNKQVCVDDSLGNFLGDLFGG